jgi:hypothetical protein
MVSSRCTDLIAGNGSSVSLSAVRRDLKREIEKLLAVGSNRAFEVWISEEGLPGPGDESAWEHCMALAVDSDLFISIFNGHSGWSRTGETVGICEAELVTAIESNPAKVRIISLAPLQPRAASPEAEWDASFKKYVEELNVFSPTVRNAGDLKAAALKTTQEAVVEMAIRGGRIARSAKGYLGQALAWNRLSFADRKQRIEEELTAALSARAGSRRLDPITIVTQIKSKPVAMRCAGVPASLGIAAARELVGQPFLDDYKLIGRLRSQEIGPVHVIGCHANVTESQARRQLGFPDATIVTTHHGVWVADPVQKIQVLFLRGCVDAASTRLQLQSALTWLDDSHEAEKLVIRAAGRARIARIIAKEAKRR